MKLTKDIYYLLFTIYYLPGYTRLFLIIFGPSADGYEAIHKVIYIVVRSPDRGDLLTIKYIQFLFAMFVLKNLILILFFAQ